MIRCFCALVFLLALLIAPSAIAAPRWRAIEDLPDQTAVRVDVAGKTRVYYRIAAGKEVALQVKGPGRLKIVSRAEVLPGARGTTVPYRVSLREGARLAKEQVTESSVSDQAALLGGVAVCKSRTFTWVIPEGSHRIRFSETGAPGVLVRFLVSSASDAAPPMISMTPIETPRTVTVVEGEKTIPYYSVLPGKPVRWRVVGPTRLELTSRLDFDPTMRGSQSYRLAVLEEGKKPQEFEFKTSKATTASYSDLKDRVPSKLDRAVLQLAAGTHELSIELKAPANGSVEIHARIPEPSSGEEE
jgi:hypothetical protein